jgi:hypothetical protein
MDFYGEKKKKDIRLFCVYIPFSDLRKGEWIKIPKQI